MSLTMGFPKKLVNIWILLAVSTFPPSASGKAITCTAGDFAAGTNASFVCYFPDDIDNHDSVYIQRYPLNAPTDASGSQVLLCKVAEVKASTCEGKDGYVFKGYTRNTILVEVVSVTEEAAGRYMCQFVPPSQSPTDMCNLTVHGAVTPSNLDDHHSSTSAEKKVAPTIPQTGETGKVSVEVFVPVIIMIVIAIAVVFIFVIIMYRRHQRSKESSSAPTETGEQETRGSVNSPAAELNESGVPLLEREKQDTSSTSLAARPDDSTIQPPPPPDETSTSHANRNTQNFPTLRPPHTPDTSFTPFTTGANDAESPLVNQENYSTASPPAGSDVHTSATLTTPGNSGSLQAARQGSHVSLVINAPSASTLYASAGSGVHSSPTLTTQDDSGFFQAAGPVVHSLSVVINTSSASTPCASAGPGHPWSVQINTSGASTPCAPAGPGMSLPMMMNTPRATRTPCTSAGPSNSSSPVRAAPSASPPYVSAESGNHTSGTKNTPCNSASPLEARYRGSAETTTDRNDFEWDNGVEMSGRKTPDKPKGIYVDSTLLSNFVSFFAVNDYYKNEKNEKCMSLVTDSNKSELTSLFLYVNELLKRVKETIESAEQVKSDTASYVEPSGNSQCSKEILQKYLKDLSKFKTKENVHRAIDCIQQLLDHVERNEVDAQIHKAIRRMAPPR